MGGLVYQMSSHGVGRTDGLLGIDRLLLLVTRSRSRGDSAANGDGGRDRRRAIENRSRSPMAGGRFKLCKVERKVTTMASIKSEHGEKCGAFRRRPHG